MGETSGFVKFIADAETDELLGAHMIGPNVSELIRRSCSRFEYRGSSEDIGITVHSHPTLSRDGEGSGARGARTRDPHVRSACERRM